MVASRPLNAYVLDYLVLAVVLFHQIGAAAALDRRDLAVIVAQINGAGRKLLRKFYRMKL